MSLHPLRRHLVLNMTWVENRGLRTFCGRWVYNRSRGLTKSQFQTAMNQEGDSNLCYFCLNGSRHFFDSILSHRRKLH